MGTSLIVGVALWAGKKARCGCRNFELCASCERWQTKTDYLLCPHLAKAKQKQVGKKPMRSSCQVFLQHYKSLECYGVWMCLAWDIGFTDAASTRVAPTRSRPHRLLPKQLGPSIRRIRRSIEMRIEMDQSMRIQSIWMIDQDQWAMIINKNQ